MIYNLPLSKDKPISEEIQNKEEHSDSYIDGYSHWKEKKGQYKYRYCQSIFLFY